MSIPRAADCPPASPDPARPGAWTPCAERLFVSTLGLVILVGCALRVSSLGRSLFLDEAWVINSVRAGRITDMLYYRDWVQTSPPLFLMLLRPLRSAAAGHPEYFRMLSVLAGIGTLLAFYPLARRFLERPFALAALFLLACSPGLILYSQSVKQYATDTLCCVLALQSCFWLGTEPAARRLWLWTAGMTALFALSFTTVFLLPGACLGLLRARLRASSRHDVANLWQVLGAIGVLGAAVLIMDVAYVRPNAALGALDDYWHSHGGFAPSDQPFQLWFRYGVLAGLLEPLPFFVNELPWQLGLSVLALSGAAGLLSCGGGSGSAAEPRRNLELLLLPFIALAAANALGFYPVGATRLTVFAFPITAILLLRGAQTLCTLATPRAHAGEGARSLPAWASVLAIVALTGTVVTQGMLNGRPRLAPVLPYENSLGALRHLQRSVLPGDSLYLQAYVVPQFHAYAPGFIDPVRVFEGRSALRCCVPAGTGMRSPAADEVAEEVGRVVAQGTGGRIWAVIGLPYLDSQAAGLYEQAFAAQACVRQGLWRFGRALLYRWQCAAPVPQAFPHAARVSPPAIASI